MKLLLAPLLGLLATAAGAQPVATPPPPASAPLPMTAASQVVPTRNATVRAAENAKAPGVQRPEERVTPQLSVPLRSRSVTAAAAPASLPGAIDDGAARCLAVATAAARAACERGLAASAPPPPNR